jgi:acyl-CoA synthetase (NDP forming)
VPTEAEPEVLGAAVAQTIADDEVDVVLVVIAPPLPGATVDSAIAAVADAATGADKPVVATIVGRSAGARYPVPHFPTVEEAVRALARVVRYAAWRREPVGEVPQLSNVDVGAAQTVVDARGTPGALLATYGVSELDTRPAANETEVLAAARVVKAAGNDLRHRLDLGAVRLDLGDARSLRTAYAEISARFGPDVLVQPMAPPGVACVIEAVDDPAFGPVVGFGMGGIATELLGDRAWRVAPLTDTDAAALVDSPRAARMLHGYRAAPSVDTAAIADLLLRVGQLANDNPEVKRLVLNPVLVHAEGLSVVHAEITYGDSAARPDTGPRRLRT